MKIVRVIPVDEPSPKSLKNIFSEIVPSKHANRQSPSLSIPRRMQS